MADIVKKILVTGGAGFIASHLVDALVLRGHNVVVVDNLSTGDKKNINKKVIFYKADIQSGKIPKIFEKEKPEIVFHFAAQINVRKSVENPINDAGVNILGGLNILENCRKFGVKKVIFSSTGGAIYGDATILPTPETYPEYPLSPYGIAKLATEKYLYYYHQAYGIPFVALRLGNVYGPRQSFEGEAGVVAIFCEKVFSGKQPVIYGDGLQTRDFVYVLDVVGAALLALEPGKAGVFNIGTATQTNINQIFSMIKQESGFTGNETHAAQKSGEQQKSCLDYTKAKDELGWEPKYVLEKGLHETVAWFKKHT